MVGVVSEGGGAECDIKVLMWINSRQPISPVKDKYSNQSCVMEKINADCVICEEGKKDVFMQE